MTEVARTGGSAVEGGQLVREVRKVLARGATRTAHALQRAARISSELGRWQLGAQARTPRVGEWHTTHVQPRSHYKSTEALLLPPSSGRPPEHCVVHRVATAVDVPVRPPARGWRDRGELQRAAREARGGRGARRQVAAYANEVRARAAPANSGRWEVAPVGHLAGGSGAVRGAGADGPESCRSPVRRRWPRARRRRAAGVLPVARRERGVRGQSARAGRRGPHS